MKLIEIKNSLAKLHYEPADFMLVLSDFLTVDDGNQKILAQVVSIETTSNAAVNSAIVKFSLDLNADGSFAAYSGYVPTLDALVSKTPQKVLQNIFSDENNGINLGQLTNSSELIVKIKPSLTEDFLYIQSDRHELTRDITEKLLAFNALRGQRTLFLDLDNLHDYPDYSTLTLGDDFKLPIDSAVLNYIYENDLTGLTVEQKTIVQDIVLEIQEYIDSLEEGFIPFEALLNVVNEIYESDKSVGVILLRNKLLKYKQMNIFASNIDEICSIQASMENNPVTVLKLHRAEANWQRETMDFILNFVQDAYYLVFEAVDGVVTKQQINEIYKNNEIKPIILSKYDVDCASYIKAFAKNLILYKPLMQQKAFSTYNSFLNKLSAKEFIISGESTYYTPLILKELPKTLVQAEIKAQQTDEDINQQILEFQQNNKQEKIVVEPIDEELKDEIDLMDENLLESEDEIFQGEDDLLQESDIENMLDFVEDFGENEPENAKNNGVSELPEENIEEQIAKDVDEIFYAKSNVQNDLIDENSANFENISIDIPASTAPDNDLLEDGLLDEPLSEKDDLLLEDDLDFIDSLDESKEIQEPDILDESENNYEASNFVPQPEIPLKSSETLNVPVYDTEIKQKSQKSDIAFAEGNIVYHEKYGRGVIEQLINYGNKTFCAILFDNIGRRLIDPNVADLKHM